VQVRQMPMMFLSGIFFSFDFLPGFLQTVARFLPLTYLADALRQVMVTGLRSLRWVWTWRSSPAGWWCASESRLGRSAGVVDYQRSECTIASRACDRRRAGPGQRCGIRRVAE